MPKQPSSPTFPAFTPHGSRPLSGRTILAVEDSRFSSDALRLMSIASGARLRRADCLASARRHLAVYRPAVLIIDMGLPDGSGADLLREMSDRPVRPSLVAISGDPDTKAHAIAAGCDVFLDKPLPGLAAFQRVIIQSLPTADRPSGPRGVVQTGEALIPDPLALREDLNAMAALLYRAPTDPHELSYATQFLRGVALSSGDIELARAVNALSRALDGKASGVGTATRWLTKLVQARLNNGSAVAFGAC
ncbi:MAG: response regulator [Brevirhabdus sp.]